MVTQQPVTVNGMIWDRGAQRITRVLSAVHIQPGLEAVGYAVVSG